MADVTLLVLVSLNRFGIAGGQFHQIVLPWACSRRAAARHFGVSESFAVKLLQRASKLKTLRPARQGRPAGSRLDTHGAFLVAQVEARPDITMPEPAARLVTATGVGAAPAVLSRFLCRRGFTYKKR
ncbi:hypothetical protein [Bosea sp. TND4EK4]|uniref:hypothetical protein n=1 Tax=Bosea sp. TND4EK4 TaxID=1907408 RepID=UPI000954E94C|nr:hypothetical protein [Bosea sp. TND4EK4]SIR44082.1 hypothetical protein SAMN05880592_12141 [Bosea sp. TND4EK4]